MGEHLSKRFICSNRVSYITCIRKEIQSDVSKQDNFW